MSNDTSINSADEESLQFTQSIRNRLIKEMTKEGIPQDKDSRYLLISALDSMDGSILKKAKIVSEDKKNKANSAIAQNIAQVLLQNRKQRQQLPVLDVPELPSSIQAPQLVPGETDIGIHDIDFKTFMES